ncbi:MAG: DUF4830 domain-containing protein [Clostridiales bacterium]|nr:DUF4830 domain-containing protein [Clostridiales bacterium]
MFIVTAKLSGRKLLCGAAALAAVLLGVHVAAQMAGEVSALGTAAGSAMGAIADSTAEVSTKVTNNEERVAYLAACGWTVDPDSCVMQEVVIPSDFDEVYQRYVQMQARQGFDLEKYRGKRVKLATYTVQNVQDGVELEANLLIRKNRVIAGDITSLTEGGTAYGLMDTEAANGAGSAEN